VRRLSAEEEALWAEVAATIRPLSREPLKPPVNAAEARPRPARRAPVRPAPAKIEQKQPAAPPGTLDSGWDRRLRTGSVEPDRVLDLHGHSLDQAWTAIDRGLEAAIRSGERVVLLVTGHARPGAPRVERGKIRAAVHDWLVVSRHAPRIAAVRGAHRRHGGRGSLYIILRRNRPGSTFS
jgi:DNA-nicking Smr family endonuclease